MQQAIGGIVDESDTVRRVDAGQESIRYSYIIEECGAMEVRLGLSLESVLLFSFISSNRLAVRTDFLS